MKKQTLSYEHTIYASYLGYITQAIVNNLAPLLFLTFQKELSVSLAQITMITTINFAVQLFVDLASTKLIDRIGYRTAAVAAHLLAALGLIGMAVLPTVLPDAYTGLLLAVILYAVGGGLIEVIISPIVESCPTEKKDAAMSLLHSFYCWGHVGVVLLSTLFFHFAGVSNWRILALLWAIIPIVNCFYFTLVPLFPIVAEGEELSLGGLVRQRVFWLLMVIMVCAGASEQAMSQWASSFAESALHVSKTIGDLAGPCAFAVLMGLARALYGKYSEKLRLRRTMLLCAVLCIGCYLVTVFSPSPVVGLIGCAVTGFSVGIFWPGTFSTAALRLPSGGTAMYALLALAGDIGCSSGPTVVGMVASANDSNLKAGLLAAILFPVVIFVGIAMLREKD